MADDIQKEVPETKEQPEEQKTVSDKLNSLKEETIGNKIEELKQLTEQPKHKKSKDQKLFDGLATFGAFALGSAMGGMATGKKMGYVVGGMTGALAGKTVVETLTKDLISKDKIISMLSGKFPHMNNEQFQEVLKDIKEEDFVALHDQLVVEKDPKKVIGALVTFGKEKHIKLSPKLLSYFTPPTESNASGETGGLSVAEAGKTGVFLETLREFLGGLGDKVKLPEWLETLSVEKFTSDLNIPTKEELDKLVKEKGYFGLLFSWAEKMKVDINMGQVVLMLHHGIKQGILKKEAFNKLVEAHFGSLKAIKEKLNNTIKEHSELLNFLPDQFHGKDIMEFILEQSDELVEWIGKNPYISSLTVVGGAVVISSPATVMAMGGCLSALVGGLLLKQVKIFFKNPANYVKTLGTAAILAGGAYLGRREYMERLLDLLYDPTVCPNKEEFEKVKNEGRTFFRTILNISEKDNDYTFQKQIPSFLQTLLVNPIAAGIKEANETLQAFDEGKFSLLATTGGVSLLCAGLSAPIMMSKEAFSLLQSWMKAKDEKSISVDLVVTGGVETFVFYRTGKVLKHIYLEHMPKQQTMSGKILSPAYMWKAFMSVVPFTPEWKFVWTSVIHEMPLIKSIVEGKRHIALGAVKNEITLLEEALQEIHSLSETEAKYNSNKTIIKRKLLSLQNQLNKINTVIFSPLERKKLNGNSLHGELFHQVQENLEGYFSAAKKQLTSISSDTDIDYKSYEKLRQSFYPEVGKGAGIMNNMKRTLSTYDSATTSFIARCKALYEGNFTAAFHANEAMERLRYESHLLENGFISQTELSTSLRNGTMTLLKGSAQDGLEAINKKLQEAIDMNELKDIAKYNKEKAFYLGLNTSKESCKEGVEAFTKKLSAELKNAESLLPTERAKVLEQYAEELKLFEQGTQLSYKNELETLQKDLKKNGTKLSSELAKPKLEELKTSMLDPLLNEKKLINEQLVKQFQDLPKELQTSGLASKINSIWEASTLSKAGKALKGRGIVALALTTGILGFQEANKALKGEEIHLMSDIYTHLTDPSSIELMKEILIPFYGAYKSGTAAVSGKNYDTGKAEGSLWDRSINTGMAAAMALGDIATLAFILPSGGSALLANIVGKLAALAKGSVVAERLFKLFTGPIKLLVDKIGIDNTMTFLKDTLTTPEKLKHLEKVSFYGTLGISGVALTKGIISNYVEQGEIHQAEAV